MHEGVFLQPDIDECRLQAVFQVLDLALEDAADDMLLGRALDVELFEVTVLHHGHARLETLRVNDDLFRDLLSN